MINGEALEHRVIRELGMELAQARVDTAFLRARLEAVRESVKALEDLQHSMLSSPTNESVDIPMGMSLVPGDIFTVLYSLLA